jgi:uncharacterized membrane protein
MGQIRGERSVDVDAPLERCYAIAADIENAAVWQGSLKDVEVLSRDGAGRPEVVDSVSDAKVREIRSRLRFTYDEPSSIRWRQEKGDVKALDGWWTLEDLGDGRTRATYGLEVDPGRILGMLLRGPVEGRVRDSLLNSAADGLKQHAEQG